MKVICITGTGHCGSTLIGLLLSKHPDLVSIGEFHSFNEARSRTKKGLHPTEDEKYETVNEILPDDNLQIYRTKTDTLLGRGRYFHVKSTEEVDKEAYWKLYDEVYREILEQAGGKQAIVTSCPIEHADLLNQSDLFDVTVLHLVRNRSAVVWSYMRKYNKPLVQLWRYIGVNFKILLYARKKELRTICLRYEFLADYTDEMMEKLFKEIGLRVNESILQREIGGRYMVGGNGMRHTDKLEVKRDYRYKKEMPKFWFWASTIFLWPVRIIINIFYKTSARNEYLKP